jgi:hypothetical protein
MSGGPVQSHDVSDSAGGDERALRVCTRVHRPFLLRRARPLALRCTHAVESVSTLGNECIFES